MRIRPSEFHGAAALCVFVWIGLCLPVLASNPVTPVAVNPPILISQPTSTRAVAIDSLSFTSEPFALDSPNAAGAERRTRIMLFAMNLKLQPGESLTSVTAEAEDAAHRHYSFTVEYVGPVPDQEWLTAVVLRLNDSLSDVGDVLVRVSYDGVPSNRVRIGIGHVGGGPPDDQGAVPTPVKPFTISGQIRDDDNEPLPGAELTLTDSTDGSFQTTTTGADGRFSLGAWPGHSIIVTPTSNAVLSFSAQSFNKISADQVLAFRATRRQYSIAGKLTGSVGNGTVPGATVILSGFRTATTTTDSNGNYVFPSVAAGGGYTVTVTQTDYYTFAPQSFSSLSADRIVNFAGVLRSYTVSGWVQLGPSTLEGLEIPISGSQTGTVTTDANGNYSVVLPAGGNYTITPSLSYYDFTPVSQIITDLRSDQINRFFVGSRQQFSINGKLKDQEGNGLAGMTVILTGAPELKTSVTDGTGQYAFMNLDAGHNYTVTPNSTVVYVFTPHSLVDLRDNQTFDFTGLRRLVLSGRVKDENGNALIGVTVTLSGTESGSTITAADGSYSLIATATGNYTVTPLDGQNWFTFAPASAQYINLATAQSCDFAGTRRYYSIAGKLTGAVGSGTVPGATVILSGFRTATTTTDSNGNYVFPSVAAGGGYTLTVTQTDYYTFAPQSFSSLSADRILNFAGVLRSYTVSGWVQLGPSTLEGLEIPISGSQTGTVTTDANGNYSIVLPAGGNYTITPSLTYYDFTPVSQIITDLRSDQINRFFVGSRKQFSISGELKDQEGNGLAGMTVILTGAPELRTSVTDSTGHYMFTNLDAGYNYTVTPNSTVVYVFTPHSFVDLRENQTFDFTGLRRLVLSGRVKDENGNGLIGVTVTLSGTESGSTITVADGSYSLIATATGNYTVTPSVGQNWFNFAPSAAQYTNLADAQAADFTASLAPIPDPPFVLEFDGTPKTVDYGPFWPEGVNLGHFFWEFWAMPGSQAGATYMLSDGYGGAHALLFGVGSFNTSEVNRYELLGNIFDGVTFDNYFGSDVGPAVGEWAHFAVGWDGQNIITYYNGVPVGKTPFSGPRRTPGPGGGGGRLLIGGSDHSNFNGRIAEVRGYEDANPREGLPGGVEASFAPQTVFGLGGNLLSYYFRSAPSVADLSPGYRGLAHAGIPRGTTAGIIFDCNGCPPPQFVIDPSAPNFATGAPPPPGNLPPAAPAPAGALVFDSFSRANSTYTFGGHGGLSSTESGSAGIQAWQTNQPAADPQPFGILNARAVLLANSTAVAWVPTGSLTGDVDVRVNRYTGRWGSGIHSGLSFRVVDANNFFFAYTSDSGGNPNTRIVRVGYYLNGQRVDLTNGETMPSSWTTLRVVTTHSGNLSVYVDSALVYSSNNPILATATGAGLYSDAAEMGLVNRWDNFAVLPAP